MLETLLGGLLGGVFRCIPELLKWLDSKDERKHELDMQDKQLEFTKLQGNQKMAEIGAQNQGEWNTGYLEALKSAIAAQAQPTGVKWIDGFNALMRPLIAFQWVILLYPATIVAVFLITINSGTAPSEALLKCFGPDEKAIASGIINFFFLNRVFDKAKV